MDAMFYVVPVLIMAAALFGGYRAVYRSWQLSSAWNSGLTAEGRCLRTYTTTSGGGRDTAVHTTLHHVYEFTTRDGRAVRFDETGGPATVVVGDTVTVYYTPGREAGATARRPSPVGNAVGTVSVLAFLGVVVLFCIGFMVSYHDMSLEF